MSAQDYSHVLTGTNFTIPAAPANSYVGPFTLYQLQPSETVLIEAMSLTVTAGAFGFGATFQLQLTDPSGNVLWQYRTPFVRRAG